MNSAETICSPNTASEPILSEEDRLTAEANHRVANSLSLIAGFARLEAARVAREGRSMSGQEVAMVLRNMAARIQGVGLLHQLLAHQPEGELVDLRAYLQRLCADLESGFGFAGRIELREIEAQCHVPAELARPIAVMVSELVTNAMKYAHPTGVPGRITLRCHRSGDALTIEVMDDGVGLPEGFDTDRDGGLGLKLVRSLCGPQGAKLNFHSSSLGLGVRIVLPVAG